MREDHMVGIAGVVVAALLVGLSAFQIALAAGAPWGRAAYGGVSQPRLTPRLRVTSAVAAVVWALVAVVTLVASGVVPVPAALDPSVVEPALIAIPWVLVGLFAVAVLANAATRSRLERAIWLPFSLVQLAAMLVIALGR